MVAVGCSASFAETALDGHLDGVRIDKGSRHADEFHSDIVLANHLQSAPAI